jgi:hypothetical protein
MQRTARLDHPEVREIVPSHHCLVRFRERRPFRELGADAVTEALIAALEDADVSGWPPDGWAATASRAYGRSAATWPSRSSGRQRRAAT